MYQFVQTSPALDAITGQVITGDALTELRKLPSDHFACVVTSPPYNGGWTNPASKAGHKPGRWRGEYEGFDDRLPEPEYLALHRGILEECLRVLQPEGAIWYVHVRRPSACAAPYPTLVDRLLEGFPVRQELIWDKGSPGPGICHDGKGGAYYSTPAYESIFLLTQGKEAKLNMNIAKMGNVWRFPRSRVRGHNATFPLNLAERCIKATSCPGPVLDPYLGSGTTAVAARNLGRSFVGIEQSATYVELATQRIIGAAAPTPALL